MRSARFALVGALIVLCAFGVVDAGADDPTQTTDPGAAPTVTVGPDGTNPSKVTTTTDPNAPPVTSGAGGFGGPKVDPEAPEEPPMPDPSPEIRVLLDQLLGLKRTQFVAQQQNVELLTEAYLGRYQARENAAKGVLDRSRSALRLTNLHLRKIEGDLRADAMARYMDPGATGIGRLIDVSASDGNRAVLISATTDVHLRQRRDALAQRASIQARIRKDLAFLAKRQAETARARARAESRRKWAELAVHKVDEERDEVRTANLRLSTSDDGNTAPAGDWSLPIAGESVFTAPELAQWFIQRGFPSRAQAPITDLAKYYIDEGAAQGIRGDMAFAQSVLETGSFTNPDTILLNNFAGVGHCDTCASGFAFATPELGVRAQIQLLADYTERDVKLAHPLVDRRLHGPSGCCQTWWQLTHTWATAGNYGPKIMGIYREMLYWLVVERGMRPVVGPS